MKAKFESDLLRVKAKFEEVVHSDILLNFVLFVQFKKREKDPWWSVIFSKAAEFTKSNTPLLNDSTRPLLKQGLMQPFLDRDIFFCLNSWVPKFDYL